jgi:hypothetical protein
VPATARRGTKPHPRIRLTTDLRRAIDTSGASRTALAEIGGFSSLPNFSALLYQEFAASPLTVSRLKKIGSVLGVAEDRLFEDPR